MTAGTGTASEPIARRAAIERTPIAYVGLDPARRQRLTGALRALPAGPSDPVDGPPPAVRRVLDRVLADVVTAPLRRLRRHEGPPALIIDGLPLIDEPGPTPVDGRPTDERLPMAKSVVTWIAERMGVFLLGFPNIADGRFFHDVNPVRGTTRPLSSKGAELALPCHSDSAANDDRPDYLLLWAIRSPLDSWVSTGYAEVATALRLLDGETIRTLRQPRFRIQVPTIVDVDGGSEQLSSPVALVSGPPAAPEIRLHASRTECLDPVAAAALAALTGALETTRTDVELLPGRMLLINNRRGVHCRGGFAATYGPEERWLLRSYLLIDPWAHRAAVMAGDVLVGPAADA